MSKLQRHRLRAREPSKRDACYSINERIIKRRRRNAMQQNSQSMPKGRLRAISSATPNAATWINQASPFQRLRATNTTPRLLRSAHDDHIKSQYQSLLSSTPARISSLEMCSAAIGANEVRRSGKQKVHVCPALAKAMWQKTNFDRCGLNLGGERPVVMPRQDFKNATEFLAILKPPFFEDFEVVVDDDSDCFCNAAFHVAAASIDSIHSLGLSVSSFNVKQLCGICFFVCVCLLHS